MLRFRSVLPQLALAAALICLPVSAALAGWNLVWNDEFAGSSLDLSKWEPQIGNGCPSLCFWGNNELEYYRAENATVSGGMLTIEAKQESFGGMGYTSARLRTRNLGDWLYGRVEMRAKLPTGRGLWPAFWMLPTDQIYGGWAASGEIDIMEIVGHEPDKLHGTIHHGGQWPNNIASGNSITLPAGELHTNFHVFALEWEPTELRWYVDGQLYGTQTDWNSNGNAFPAPFDERFHLLLNIAVGGNWPGNPDGSTVFPQQMVVDYVRVYQQEDDCFVMYDGMEHASPYGNGWFAFGGSVGGGGISANGSDLPPLMGETASLETSWGSGGTPGFMGGFGRDRAMELAGITHFEFWINPDAGQSYDLEINLQDDDDGDDSIPSAPNGADDEFQRIVRVGSANDDVLSGGGWQHVVLPLSEFADDNSYHYGGNGVFDPVGVGSGGNGMMQNIVVAILSLSGANVSFRTDRWAFTRRTASAEGRVWEDLDLDGSVDAGEPGLAGVSVELIDSATSTVLETVTTAANGDYGFSELLPASYEIRVDPSSLPGGLDGTFDPDGTGTPDRFLLDLACDEANSGNFGYAAVTSSPSNGQTVDLLHAAVPNPFNPSTALRYELREASTMELLIFDSLGRLVRVLERGPRAAGEFTTSWNGMDDRGSQVASGLYFASLRTERGRAVQRLVLLK